MDLYTRNALRCSRITTLNYSTSFTMGVWMLKKHYRPAIYAIYGFVRFADEIVDTFHEQDQKTLLKSFREQTFDALEKGFSTNPILHSFQWVVKTYGIDREHIEAFLYSMELDLWKIRYNRAEYQRYIYGSAEVVGLMCLRVFYQGDDASYQKLVNPARKLGEAFQKVNFLRDMLSDYHERGRVYFPQVDFDRFDISMKRDVEKEIEQDFQQALPGIRDLRKDIRLGVFVAYSYYQKLLIKIVAAEPEDLLEQRFRISNRRKIFLLVKCYLRQVFNRV